MKTIFITCFTGLISRNILATDAFELLKTRSDLTIVLVAPESRVAALQSEFGGPNVIVEGVPMPLPQGMDWLLWVLATNLLATNTRRVQRLAKVAHDGNWLDYALSSSLSLLGRSRFIRRTFRRLVRALLRTAEFIALYERYAPDLVFATDVYALSDVKLACLGERRGVTVVGMIRSWDNVTSKTLLMFVPSYLAVNTERTRKEAMAYGDVPADRFFVCGVPHYDRYRNAGERTHRDVFFKRLGLNPGKKLILFTPPSDHYLKHDPITPVVLDALAEAGAGVLVRFPLVGRVTLGDYQPPANVVFDEPGSSPDFTEVHLSRDADRHLADSIFHSDLVITWASTMIIDAAVFDKPIILVGFDAEPRPYAKSITRYYDYDHQRHILELGGARLVKNPEELVQWTERYLADPALDRAGRERIRREHCGRLDGKAGERLAKYVLEKLRS